MNTTNENELRSLDAWIAEHVMGLMRGSGNWDWFPHDKATGISNDISLPLEHYSTDPAAAMDVLNVCMQNTVVEVMRSADGIVIIRGGGITETAPTLELAICRFARSLFEREG